MRRFPRLRPLIACLAAVLPPLAACGSGTAALVSGSGSGGGNAATVLSGFQLQGAKVAPATIAFTVVDAEADPARVELLYALPGETPRPMTSLTPLSMGLALDGNVASASSSANGVTHRLSWDFTAETGLPSDGRFVAGAGILARIEGGTQGLILGANADAQGLGNDAPMILDPTPELAGGDEALGVVPVDFAVADSSSDPVDVLVEYAVVEPGQPLAWLVATPAGSEPNPIPGIEAAPTPTVRTFFWDTDVDLAALERDVVVRFSPTDGVQAGAPAATDEFRVDNNAAPSLTILEGQLFAGEDARFGIPIPYTVSDAEGDAVEVIVQWRREGEAFPELPDDEQELAKVLADPVLRRAHRIAAPYRELDFGRLAPLDAQRVRLPELAGRRSDLVAHGLVGRTLELLRPSQVPAAVASTWGANPLSAPLAAFPLGEGPSALVVDGAAGGWSVLELDLSTGAVVREIATSLPDSATAAALERGGAALLVATEQAGAWAVVRVELESGAVETLATRAAGDPPGPVRGIASVGRRACALTVGDALLRVDYPATQPSRTITLLDRLATPSGVASDPRDPGRLWVAERDVLVPGGRGRIFALDLATGAREPLTVDASRLDAGALRRPSALACDPSGRRLFTIARTAAGAGVQLVGLHLRPVAHAEAWPVTGALPDAVGSVAAGRLDALTACAPAADGLYVGGGVQQRRQVASFEPLGAAVRADAPFDPTPVLDQRWRLASGRSARSGTPLGERGTFVWDSSEAGRGDVFLRATPRDAENGDAGTTSLALHVAGLFEDAPRAFVGEGTLVGPYEVFVVDWNGDGAPDLLSHSAFGDVITLHAGDGAGGFSEVPLTIGPTEAMDQPLTVAAGDVNGDGRLDLASANALSENVTVFLQDAQGGFADPPLVVEDPLALTSPGSLRIADLDRDGRPDLVCGQVEGVAVFFQAEDGTFPAPAVVLPGISGQTFGVVDYDGDGLTDVLGASADGAKAWLQVEPRAFAAEPQLLGGPPASELAAGDLDADGDVDLVLSSFGASELYVLWRDDLGGLDPEPTVLGGTEATDRPRYPSLGDLDGDGLLDVVCANVGGQDMSAFRQAAPGDFDPAPLTIRPAGLQQGFLRPDLADVDGDGALDVVAPYRALGSPNTVYGLMIAFQSGPGRFAGAARPLEGAEALANPHDVALADLDGDGLLDVIAAMTEDDAVHVRRQVAPGSFAAEPVRVGVDPFDPLRPWCLEAGDLDGDGAVDLVVTRSADSSGLGVLWGTAGGGFSEPLDSLPGLYYLFSAPQDLQLADVDGDGLVDVVGADTDGGRAAILFQDAPRSFAPPVFLVEPGEPLGSVVAVAAGDLDGDGLGDVAVASIGTDRVAIYSQGPARTFRDEPLVLDVGDKPRSIALGDLDGDGDLDIAVAYRLDDELAIYLQTAPGEFAAPPQRLGGFGILDGPRDVELADFDGDGDLDLVSANREGNGVTIFLQRLPGVFDPSPRHVGGLGSVFGPYALTVGDLDGDGDADIVTANTGSDDLAVFFGGR